MGLRITRAVRRRINRNRRLTVMGGGTYGGRGARGGSGTK